MTWIGVINSINRWVGKLTSYLILPVVAIILYEIIARYGFNRPTNWVHESSQFLFAGYIMLAGGYVLLTRSHVNVDIFYSHFPTRVRAGVDIFTSLAFFLFCFALIWKGWQNFWSSVIVLEYSQTAWAPPLYPVKSIIPIGAFLLLLQGLTKWVGDFITLITGRPAK